MKVHIKNFQSIEDVSFEIPENSFTCIVGPSNIGKSALRRALECLIYNKSEASYIRNGTKTCSIEVTFEDNTVIKWYRNNKTAGYIINGEDFTKLAGSVPDLLIDRGFKELTINKDKYQVQIASQFNNIFLLNETGGKVTELLSNLGNLNRIIKSNKSCLSDLKMNKSKLNIRREDILSAKEKLKSYKGLDEQRHQVDILKDYLKDIRVIKERFNAVKKIEISLNKSIRIVKILRPVKEIEIAPFDLSLNKLKMLNSLLVKLTYSQKIVSAYTPIRSVGKIEMDISADTLISLKSLLLKYASYEVKHLFYLKLSNVSDIEFNLKEEYERYLKINLFLKKLITIESKIKLYQNLPKSIPSLEEFNISKFEKITGLYKRAQELKNKIIKLRNQIKVTDEKLIELEEEREQIHKTLGVCPLCDKEF